MAGRPSAVMVKAMGLILEGNMTAYAAAKMAGISLSTMYRSPLYKMWRDGHTEQLQAELARSGAKPKRISKRERFIQTT